MKATLIVLALFVSAGLVAGFVAPPTSAEPPSPAYARYEAVTRIPIGALPAADTAAAVTAKGSDGAAIPLIDVFGAGVLITTVVVAVIILLASRRSPSLARSVR